ncbi:uncharacterized protein METZ01_LOCUS102231 [marine metagenome]|uniref:Uncharacterized protein n=1 Tax=marine metagenome TaxID=408172 RepID=A0A381WBR7_9ZZZZ
MRKNFNSIFKVTWLSEMSFPRKNVRSFPCLLIAYGPKKPKTDYSAEPRTFHAGIRDFLI